MKAINKLLRPYSRLLGWRYAFQKAIRWLFKKESSVYALYTETFPLVLDLCFAASQNFFAGLTLL